MRQHCKPISVLAALLLLAACSGDSETASEAPPSSNPAPSLELLATGVVVSGPGEETVLFGADADTAVGVMTTHFGDPDEVSEWYDPVGAGCGDRWSTQRWDDLELLFVEGPDGPTFAEWVLDSRHAPGSFGPLPSGIGPGSTVADLRAAFPAWDGEVVPLFEYDPAGPGSIWFETVVTDGDPGTLAAITSDTTDAGTVDLLWAGGACSHFVS